MRNRWRPSSFPKSSGGSVETGPEPGVCGTRPCLRPTKTHLPIRRRHIGRAGPRRIDDREPAWESTEAMSAIELIGFVARTKVASGPFRRSGDRAAHVVLFAENKTLHPEIADAGPASVEPPEHSASAFALAFGRIRPTALDGPDGAAAVPAVDDADSGLSGAEASTRLTRARPRERVDGARR